MARLFITPREINFFSDITKEIFKDINGQKIYYYPISELKSSVDSVYLESSTKVFDNPIEIEALVSSPTIETKITEFGPDQSYSIEVWMQYRDLVDKKINIVIGDFFSFGEVIYEITEMTTTRNIYGRAEDKDGIKITGTKARESLFKTKILGPTDRIYTDKDSVQDTFYQQKGFKENTLGPTGDKRELIENGILEPIATQPTEVSSKGDQDGTGNSFYGEDK
jgi:hypothetical protein